MSYQYCDDCSARVDPIYLTCPSCGSLALVEVDDSAGDPEPNEEDIPACSCDCGCRQYAIDGDICPDCRHGDHADPKAVQFVPEDEEDIDWYRPLSRRPN